MPLRRGPTADPGSRIGGKLLIFAYSKTVRDGLMPARAVDHDGAGFSAYAAFSSKVFAFPSSSSRAS